MKKIVLLLGLLTSATAFAQFSGKGTGDYGSPYQVTTAAQLDELRNCLKDETYVKLMNDIDLTEYIANKYSNNGWAPINCTDKVFDYWNYDDEYSYRYVVYFEGNNKTISGLSGDNGLFESFAGEMKNLTVECNISGGSYVGGLCGGNDGGYFYNCKVKGTVRGEMGKCIGGLCGFNDNGNFESCEFCSNSSVIGSICNNTGGICGQSSGGMFYKCKNQGDVKGEEFLGGIVGGGSTYAEGCYSSGTLYTSHGCAGGIMGMCGGSMIVNCSSSGSISARFGAVGGIVGSVSYWFGSDIDYTDYYEAYIENCSSKATVAGPAYVGGILGVCGDVESVIEKCDFNGTVKMEIEDDEDDYTTEAFGGIAGAMYGRMSNCLVGGIGSCTVSGSSKVGGIVGYLRGSLVNSYSRANVTGDKYVGGICGYVDGFSNNRASILASCNYNRLVEVNTRNGEIGRIAGYVGTYCDIPYINAAKANRSDMYYPVKRMGAQLTSITENQLNGRNVSRSLAREKFFYESMGWDMENIWHFFDYHSTEDHPFWLFYNYPMLYDPSYWITYGYNLCAEKCVINKSSGGRVKLKMSHSSSVHSMLGVQFDLVLPQGVTIKKKSNGSLDIQKMGVLAKHQISCSQQADGSYRFMVYSLDMSRFDYEADYLMSIAIEVADNVKCDYYDIIVKNIIYSQLWGDDATEVTSYEEGYETYSMLEISNGMLGDVNNDGVLSVADLSAIVDHVLGKAVSNFDEGNADVNGDGSIDITDVMTVVQWIVNGKNTYNIPQNSMEEMTVTHEEGGYLLQLGNMADYTALQMNVRLPEGCKLKDVELCDARSNGHQVTKHQLEDGSWNIVVWGLDGNELRNTSTDLLRLQTTGSGAGDVVVSDIILTNHDHDNISIQAVAGGATGIAEVEAGESDAFIYDLNGVRVDNPKKGVYVRNGKKFVVK